MEKKLPQKIDRINPPITDNFVAFGCYWQKPENWKKNKKENKKRNEETTEKSKSTAS